MNAKCQKQKVNEVEITVVTTTNDDIGEGTPETVFILGNDIQETTELVNETTIIKKSEKNEIKQISGLMILNVIIVLFSVFLDMMGVSVVQPVLPFYAQKFGANATQLGALISSYALMSGIAGLFMGKLSDIFGRKKMVVFSLFGTGFGFLITGFARNYTELLIFRFITGSFGTSLPIAQAYITDLISKNSRPKYLAFIGGVAPLAFIVGPGIGSAFATFGIRVPFFVSSGLGFTGFVFAVIFLQESHPQFVTKSKDTTNNKKQPIKQALCKDNKNGNSKIAFQVWFIFIGNICSFIGWAFFIAIFAFYGNEVFNLNVLQVGYVTLVLAAMYVFSTLILFNILNKYIGVYLTSIFGVSLTGLSLLMMPAFNKSLWATLAFLVFGVGLGNGVIMPSIPSMAANFTNISNRGKTLGLISLSKSIGMVIGPLLHGQLYTINIYYPMFIGGVISFIAVLFIIIVIFTTKSSLNIRCCCCCICKEYTIDMNVSDRMREFNSEWSYSPETPTQNDYNKLGKTFGEMLSKKNYLWVKHFDKMVALLDETFPALSTESLFEHLKDIQYLRAGLLHANSNFNRIRNARHFG